MINLTNLIIYITINIILYFYFLQNLISMIDLLFSIDNHDLLSFFIYFVNNISILTLLILYSISHLLNQYA